MSDRADGDWGEALSAYPQTSRLFNLDDTAI